MMSKIDQLKAIQEMPLTAAYWMGHRDALGMELEEKMASFTIDRLPNFERGIEALFLDFDQYNDNFAHEMGWI